MRRNFLSVQKFFIFFLDSQQPTYAATNQHAYPVCIVFIYYKPAVFICLICRSKSILNEFILLFTTAYFKFFRIEILYFCSNSRLISRIIKCGYVIYSTLAIFHIFNKSFHIISDGAYNSTSCDNNPSTHLCSLQN